jgi:hypothetical protein
VVLTEIATFSPTRGVTNRVRQGGAFASGMTATGFWLGITVGRVILGFVTPRLRDNVVLTEIATFSPTRGVTNPKITRPTVIPNQNIEGN